MKAYIEQVNRELKEIIYALAEQDYSRAVSIVKYRETISNEILKSGIFLMPPKNMFKADILGKYPYIEDDLRYALDDLATSALTYLGDEFKKEIFEKYKELTVKEIQSANSFSVMAGLDINTGEIRQLTIKIEDCFTDETLAGFLSSFLNAHFFDINL